jgi:hypothetical protein
VVSGQPRQKVHKIPSQPMAGGGDICLSLQQHEEAQIEGSWSRQHRHKMRPYLNNK